MSVVLTSIRDCSAVEEAGNTRSMISSRYHTSYYGMASNPVYAFVLRKQDENWLFSASCWVKSREDYYTSFSSFPIPDRGSGEIP